MSRPRASKSRGTTLLEILIAVSLLLMIFLFLTGDLMQSSQAENVAATRTESISAANYLLAVMRQDPIFWTDWNSGPGTTDPCGNVWPAYTDSIAAPGGWHTAPACLPNGPNAGAFPDLIGITAFQFKWNAQPQASDPRVAQLTTWVLVNEDGHQDIYELHSTRANIATPASPAGILPPTATPTPCQNPCHSVAPTPPGSPTPMPSPTPTRTKKPKPSPQPSGTFE